MLKKIGVKLLLSYLILLIVAFSVSSASYSFLSKRYLINETKKNLKIESQAVADLLRNVPLKSSEIKTRLAAKTVIKAADRFVTADMLILGKDKNVIYKSIEVIDKKTLIKLAKTGKTAVSGYVGERTIIYEKDGSIKGYVVLFTKLKNLYGLNRLMSGTELVSMLAAGLVALIISLFFEKSLVRPITLLTEKIGNYSATKQLDSTTIKTGDEIQQLDECFVAMTKSISQFDEIQKKFLQNTSHELKTPLMSIQGYAEAIKEGVISGEEMDAGLQVIIEQSLRLKRTVEELLYLTKLENPEEKLHKEAIDLKELIDNACRSVKPIAEDRGILLASELQEEISIYCDSDKIDRAVVNLLSNAIRYADTKITIRAFSENGLVNLSIIDDGCGFKNDEVKKIFDRFYKGDRGNTGLGLSIVKAIIEAHGGDITAHNSTTKGAVFEIKLPYK